MCLTLPDFAVLLDTIKYRTAGQGILLEGAVLSACIHSLDRKEKEARMWCLKWLLCG